MLHNTNQTVFSKYKRSYD